ncbi:MAG: hypothetical protein ACREET_16920, partial [Stellaceae bacterium]
HKPHYDKFLQVEIKSLPPSSPALKHGGCDYSVLPPAAAARILGVTYPPVLHPPQDVDRRYPQNPGIARGKSAAAAGAVRLRPRWLKNGQRSSGSLLWRHSTGARGDRQRFQKITASASVN